MTAATALRLSSAWKIVMATDDVRPSGVRTATVRFPVPERVSETKASCWRMRGRVVAALAGTAPHATD
jgi:hypothetical protein